MLVVTASVANVACGNVERPATNDGRPRSTESDASSAMAPRTQDSGTSALVARRDELTGALTGFALVGSDVVHGDAKEARLVRFEDGRSDAGAKCVRVVFAASADVRVFLDDERGPLGTGTGPSRSGYVGDRGPVCTLHGSNVLVRIVASAPFDAAVSLVRAR